MQKGQENYTIKIIESDYRVIMITILSRIIRKVSLARDSAAQTVF